MTRSRRVVVLVVGLATTILHPACVPAAGWIKPLDLAADIRTRTLEARADGVALSPNGTLIAGRVVPLSPGTTLGVRLALRPPGGPALAEQTVSSGATNVMITSLAVAVNDVGDAVAAWTEELQGTTTDVVWLTVRPHGQSFGPAERPPMLTGEDAYHDPAVGIAGDGTVTIAFGSDCLSGGAFEVTRAQARRRAPDGSWSSRDTLASVTCADGTGYRSFRMQELPDGRAIVGFRRNAVTEIWSAVRTAPTATFASQQMPTNAGAVDQPRIAIETGGAGVTAWTSTQGIAYRYRPRSGPDVDGGPIGSSGASDPSVAMGAAGEALLVFDDVGTPRVVRIAPDGTAASPDPLGASVGSTDYLRPEIAATSQGIAVTVFHSVDGHLSGRVRPPGEAFGSPTPLGAELIDDGTDAWRVAIDDGGDAAVLWMSYHAATNDLDAQVRVYDGTPPQLGPPAASSSVIVGEAADFSIAATDVWGPVSLGWDFGDGGTDTGSPVSHTFATPGPVMVTVTAMDVASNHASAQVMVNVVVPSTTTTTLPPDDVSTFVDHVRDLLAAAIQQAIQSATLVFRLDLTAPLKGGVTATVTQVVARSLLDGATRKARTVVLAKGHRKVRKAGAFPLTMKLTKAGKKLLRTGGSVTASVGVTFKSSAGKRSSSTLVVLSR